MNEMTFWSIMKISFILPVLLVASILMFIVLIERIAAHYRWGRVRTQFLAPFLELARKGQWDKAKEMVSKEPGIIGETLKEILTAALAGKPHSRLVQLLDLNVRRAQTLLSRRLSVFGTLSFLSPLLGLLGTVLGVMQAFRDLALAGQGGPAVVAAGISEALICTAAGIGVAVTAALANNIFNARSKSLLDRMDVVAQEILILLDTEKENPHD